MFCCTSVFSQEHKTFKVRKESNLSKAVFDNTEMQLMVIDRFGNPKDNNIVSYKLYVKGKRDTKEFQGFSNRLTPDMVAHLNKLKYSAKLFFTQISVKDDDEHLISLPDVIEQWFPNCTNKKP
ncbi:MAG: hypothetical protein KF900_04725 [Bacteroidetes bacterium]|nr:hypothetical protein [Bacteroidota bacterium]